MRKAKWSAWVFIAVFTVAALGCASSGGTKPVAVTDLSSLAGTWTGWLAPPGGGSTPATWQMSPTGEYVARAGAFSAQGVAQIKDGALILRSTSGSASLATEQRTSTASVSEHPDGRLVLRGIGRGEDGGQFTFEVTRPK